jgi:Spy/CpxP family protein refolding chaperone
MTSSTAQLIAALALGLALPASAQHAGSHRGHHHHGAGQGGASTQPYAGLEGRRTKALSEENTTALLEGRGMSLALAAELNGYPGPMHVLEHAEALRLTPAQRATTEALRDRMAGEARILGARIVAMEEELDRIFATEAAEAASLAVLTASIGALSGRLREVHLVTHIAMRDALEPEQRATYARLRGYAGGR